MIYNIFAILMAFIYCRKVELKMLAFALTLRILAEPTIKTYMLLKLPGLPFNLQPDRILFIIVLVMLSISYFKIKKDFKGESPLFEKIIWLLLMFVSLSIIFNLNKIPFKEAVSTPIEIFVFIVIYHGVKYFYSERLFRVVMQSFLLLSAINAIIAMIQVGFAPDFLKIAEPRLAFGSVWRASGIFVTEYQLGYILNMAITYTILSEFSVPKKVVLISVFVVGLFCTFHRLNWLICITVIATQKFIKKRFVELSLLFIVGIIVISISTIFLVPNIQKSRRIENNKDSFLTGRLMRDTVTGRFEQYKIALKYTLHNFWGVGSYANRDYYKLMAKYGMLASPDEPLGVHNGYLAMGVMYGPMAAATFILFILFLMIYYYSKKTIKSPFSYYPFFCSLIWALANISNRANDFRTYYVILLAIFFGLFTAKIENDSQFKTNYTNN